MFQIENDIVSDNIFDKYFCCDLDKCKGTCCVIGDSGAPLEKNELECFEEIYPHVEPYLNKKNIEEIKKQGFYIIDYDGDYVTPIVRGAECVYTYQENGITKCAIEKAYFEGKTKFRKPISCHLYPIRISKYKNYDGVNYDEQIFCKEARIKGDQEKILVYQYLKEPLVRKYGEKWYKEIQNVADAYKEYRND